VARALLRVPPCQHFVPVLRVVAGRRLSIEAVRPLGVPPAPAPHVPGLLRATLPGFPLALSLAEPCVAVVVLVHAVAPTLGGRSAAPAVLLPPTRAVIRTKEPAAAGATSSSQPDGSRRAEGTARPAIVPSRGGRSNGLTPLPHPSDSASGVGASRGPRSDETATPCGCRPDTGGSRISRQCRTRRSATRSCRGREWLRRRSWWNVPARGRGVSGCAERVPRPLAGTRPHDRPPARPSSTSQPRLMPQEESHPWIPASPKRYARATVRDLLLRRRNRYKGRPGTRHHGTRPASRYCGTFLQIAA